MRNLDRRFVRLLKVTGILVALLAFRMRNALLRIQGENLAQLLCSYGSGYPRESDDL